MLEITGQIGNEMYEEKVMTAENVAKLFGITLPEKVKIAANRTSQKKDRLGQTREALGIRLNNRILGTFNGSQVQIRYYESKVNRDKNGGVSYLPTRVEVDYPMTFDTTRQKERALFSMLHTKSEASPIKGGGRKRYRLKDDVKDAQNRIQSLMARKQMEDEILMEADENKLRRIALGMAVKGQKVPAPQNKGIDELKSGLLDLMALDPADFADKWGDVSVKIGGLIQEAKLNGVIKIVARGSIRKWVYTDTGEEITAVTGKDSDLALKHFLVDAKAFEIHYPRLEDGIVSKTVDHRALEKIMGQTPKPKATINLSEMNGASVFQYAMNKKAIKFEDDPEPRVFLVNDGTPGNTLLRISNPDSWEQELISKLDEKKVTFNKLKKHLE